MHRRRIKIIDHQFIGGNSFGTGGLLVSPDNFDWYRGPEDTGEIVVFSESGMGSVDKFTNKTRIGFLLEPRAINPRSYNYVMNKGVRDKFEMILTYDKELLEFDPTVFKFYPFGGCWIFPIDQKVHQKSKNVSTIASSKRYTVGHKLRHDSIAIHKDKIDGLYGGGYNFIENKIEALKDYRFSLTIENGQQYNTFTEKLIDCFVTGTVPIYHGCPNIKDFFNPDGMLVFNNITELKGIFEKCNEDQYNKMLPAIEENFELAKNYKIPEDYMWDKYFKFI